MSSVYSVRLAYGARPLSHRLARLCAVAGLPLATTVLMMLDDWLQQRFTAANQADFETSFAVALFAFNVGLWLCGSRALVALILALLAGMELIQLGHISYFGRPLDPMALGSLLFDFDDVQQVAANDFLDHWHILPSVLLPYGAAALLFMQRMPRHVAWPLRVLALLLIAAGLLSKPYRATYRDINAFLPGPTRNALHNSINTFGFVAANGIHRPDHAIAQPPAAERPTAVPIASDARHVWLVIADSLTSRQLGLLGYERDTTPQLAARMRDGLQAGRGLAAGVATAVSLPLIMNAVREPGQLHQIRDLSTNLFRLAKTSGFNTYWISSQESKMMNDVGSGYVDMSITREDLPTLFRTRGDDAIPDLLAQQRWPDKSFVVVLLRAPHAPYEANYAHARDRYARWPDDASLPREQRLRNAYDNAVLQLDGVLNNIMTQFDRLPGPRHLVITSDHGQLLGARGMWGHNVLEPEVADVPLLAWSRGLQVPVPPLVAPGTWHSHFDMSRWLAAQLGYRIDNPNARPGIHYLQGKNLYGSNTFQEIHTGEALRFSAPHKVGTPLPLMPPAPG